MNETQRAIVEAVKARGYLDGWTPEQLGARQVVKLVEEVVELQGCIGIVKYGDKDLDRLLCDAQTVARRVFDRGDCTQVEIPEDAVKEAADCYVVLAVLTHALEQMLGREIDLEALALAKATGDVKRGVR